MFERFTDRARRALVLAQEEARALGHNFIGTEHVLLGLLAEGEGVAAQVLREMGFEIEAARKEVGSIIGATTIPGADLPEKPPFTPRAKKVLEYSLRAALELGHNYIGTEHLLIALAREGEGVAAQILIKREPAGRVRSRVLEKLSAYGVTTSGKENIAKRIGDRLRRGSAGGAAPGKPEHTPALEAIIPKAEQLAAGEPIGSHHLLLAIMEEPDSLAARVLASVGVTREALIERFTDMGTDGTTDALPAPDPYTLHAYEGGLTIRIEDPELAAKVRNGELTFTFVKRASPPDGESRGGEPAESDQPGQPESTTD